MNKCDLVPDLVEASEREALSVLAASHMSEVEIAEKILQIRGINKLIEDAIARKRGRNEPGI